MNQDQIRKYCTKVKQKTDYKKIIAVFAGLMILMSAVVVIPIYAKYNTSRYDEDAQNAWTKTHTAIPEFLRIAADIVKNDYCVDINTYSELDLRRSYCFTRIEEFKSKTYVGERVNSLLEEARKSAHSGSDSIIFNASRFYSKGGNNSNNINNGNNSSGVYYRCSPDEIESLRAMFDSLDRIYNEISAEMGYYPFDTFGFLGLEKY